MGNVKFKTGSADQYKNIEPDKETFYRITDEEDETTEVYLGRVPISFTPVYQMPKTYDPIFGNNTPEDIKQAVTEGVAEDLWSIGDTIVIDFTDNSLGMIKNYQEVYVEEYQSMGYNHVTLSAFSTAVIIDFNHNKDLETNGKSSITLYCFDAHDFLSALQIDDDDYNSIYEDCFSFITSISMNSTNSNKGGWESSSMRDWCEEFFQECSLNWQQSISPVTKYTDNVGIEEESRIVQLSDITATQDKCFLLSEYEVAGQHYYANRYEQRYQTQYKYFENGCGFDYYTWLRSPAYDVDGISTGTTPYFAICYSSDYSTKKPPIHISMHVPTRSYNQTLWAFCIVAD